MLTAILLLCFLGLQIGANALFKAGSDVPARWWLCFVAGNALGVSSIYFLMRLYARMDVNVALALAGGGAFIAVQVALAIIFGGRPAALQWVGFTLVAAGMALGSLGSRAPGIQKPVAEARPLEAAARGDSRP